MTAVLKSRPPAARKNIVSLFQYLCVLSTESGRMRFKEKLKGMIPADRRYSDNHQWAQSGSDGVITVGIPHNAQDLLGDPVFVEPPALGRKLKRGEQCGVVESVKSASDIYAPVSGEVTGVNGAFDTAPEKINQDAYGAWIFKLKPANESEWASLLDADACQKLIEAQVA